MAHKQSGFTLIELIAVVVIAGILAAVAATQLSPVSQKGRVDETFEEMNRLAHAIAGDPDLYGGNHRTAFGYVGDVGALPATLEALRTNPGGYATWKGPYIQSDYSQFPDDFKQDAWGSAYLYSGGISLASVGSGDTLERRIATSADHLLRNRITGNIFDASGFPPGDLYKDSCAITLTIPDGLGGLLARNITPDIGGYFSFDSIPIGNHTLQIIFQPTDDTLIRFVMVSPNSRPHADYLLPALFGESGALVKVLASDSVIAGCNGIIFWIENQSGSAITLTSITVNWSTPVSYYRYIRWNGTVIFDHNNPKAASGETATFTSAQAINPAQKVQIQIDGFKDAPTGGANADMNNASFTILFSDGTTFTVTTGSCP